MSSLLLYHYWRSSCSWRVRWALNHKGVPYQVKVVDLLKNEQHSEWYLKINPMGNVPTLLSGNHAMSESLAILEWIEESYPNKPLLPNTPADRQWVRQFCLSIVAGIQPLQNLRVLKHHSNDQHCKDAWANHWITSGLKSVEKNLENTAGTYCLGAQFTMADMCLVPQIYNAKRFHVDLTQFPIASKIFDKCMTREDCIRSSPERNQ